MPTFWCENDACLTSTKCFESKAALQNHRNTIHGEGQTGGEGGAEDRNKKITEIVVAIANLTMKLRISKASQKLFDDVLTCFNQLVQLSESEEKKQNHEEAALFWNNSVALFNLCEKASNSVENDILPNTLQNLTALIAAFRSLIKVEPDKPGSLLTGRQRKTVKLYTQDLETFHEWLALKNNSSRSVRSSGVRSNSIAIKPNNNLKQAVDDTLNSVAAAPGSIEGFEVVRKKLEQILQKNYKNSKVSIFGSTGKLSDKLLQTNIISNNHYKQQQLERAREE